MLRIAVALAITLAYSTGVIARPIIAIPFCLSALHTADTTQAPLCIRAGNYNYDLCKSLETLASRYDLPSDFFARLIWRESRFRSNALSPKGAGGIAQFMPGTARQRGVLDSEDALMSLDASAKYLNELKLQFGNLGLAAAAYNAGEQRVKTFLDSQPLPLETRAYVFGITGYTVEQWRNTSHDFPLARLDDKRTFLEACVALADTRRLVGPANKTEGMWAVWGAQLAAAKTDSAARILFQRAVEKLPTPIANEQPLIIRKRDGSFGFRPRYSARIGRSQRIEAERICDQVRMAGLPCFVFKNF